MTYLPNVYGAGQLFSYSALDGKAQLRRDFTATLLRGEAGLRLEVSLPRKLCFGGRVINARAVTSDLLDIQTEAGDVLAVFFDRHSLIGRCPLPPVLKGGILVKRGGKAVSLGIKECLALVTVKDKEGCRFALCYGSHPMEAVRLASRALAEDPEIYAGRRKAFYAGLALPKNLPQDCAPLYLKAASVLKANVYSAEGKLPCRWTTPDRVPHRKMWLWDSVFHAVGWSYLDVSVAEDAILALLRAQKPDGFIPHAISPRRRSAITQPPVLAWGIKKMYERTGNTDFLRRTLKPVGDFLRWIAENRDADGNGLPEWKITSDKNCRSDESGMDNSPRFDGAEAMDALDFSCYLANDCRCLAFLYEVLEDKKEAEYWTSKYDALRKQINNLLWCDEDGLYYDRKLNGSYEKMASSSCFLPLFAGVPDENKAQRLIKTLTDPQRFWSACPLPSVALDDPKCNFDMWRGGVWVNINYLVSEGLKEYGYGDLAETLKQKTLAALKKWQERTGGLYEYYDPTDRTSPPELPRKSVAQSEPDWRKHLHSICDFGWTAALTIVMLQETYR